MASNQAPPIHERLLWIVVACIAWRFAGMAASVGIYRAGVLGVALVVLTVAFGLAALVVAITPKASRWVEGPHLFAAFTFFFVVFGAVDAFLRAHTPYNYTTDAHVFGDYAARLLLQGRNPYDVSLYGAFAVHRVPIELQTPLVDGGFSDKLAYPSLSFLVLVPFVKLGIATRFAYAAALWGCTAVLYFKAPRAARPIVLVPFFADPSYLMLSFGGVTDAIWALLLCFVVLSWERRDRAALLFGLACCFKQHPWLLAPFVAIRLWQETEDAAAKKRVVARFFGIVALVFVVTNLPFFVWQPMRWLEGVVEPLVRRMVPLGDGPTAFIALAGASIPKAIFTLAFWGSLGLLVLVCARLRSGRVLMWIAPSLAFLLNYRSLSSYWYFNVFPFALELVRAPWSELEGERQGGPSLRRIGAFAGAAGAMLVALAVFFAVTRRHTLEVALDLPLRTWSARVHRVDLSVTNHASHVVKPRFWGQSVSFQPLPWRIDVGPKEIAPGETAKYSVSSTFTIAEIEADRGGVITVTDQESSLRQAIPIPADPASLSPRIVPNAELRFWNVQTGAPMWWTLSRSGAPGGYARPTTEAGRRGVELVVDTNIAEAKSDQVQFCLALPWCWASNEAREISLSGLEPQADHRIELVTDLVARDRPIAVWAHPPATANRAPLHEIYGVMLSFGERHVMVLLGGDGGSGRLPSGMPYVSLPAAPNTWTKVTLDLPGLQKAYAPDVYPRALPMPRLPYFDLPFVKLELRLVYSTRAEERTRVVFGTIEDPLAGHDERDDTMRELDAHPGVIDLWRADYEWDHGNPGRSADYLARARATEPHAAIELRSAELEEEFVHPEEARKIYERLLDRRPVEANLRLGWIAYVVDKKSDDARKHFDAALEALRAEEPLDGKAELQRLNALVGASITRAAMRDCKGSFERLAQVPATERAHLERTSPEIMACHEGASP